jgi:hypothetical protein
MRRIPIVKRLGPVLAICAALTLVPVFVVPAAPQSVAALVGLTATAEPAPPTAVRTFPTLTDIGIVWTPPENNPEAYEVQRRRPSGNWAGESGKLDPTVTKWIDPNVQPGATVEYRVLALYADGQTLPSEPVTATRPEQDPSVGEVDVLMIDADRGGSTTWLEDEIASPVAQPSTSGITRTLSAGTVQLTMPAVLPGPGSYPVDASTQPFLVRQKDAECSLKGTLTVEELAYTADLQVATMAAQFTGGSCNGAESVQGEIRVKSSKPYAALSIETPRIDLGEIRLGTAPSRTSITLKNAGLTTLSVMPQPLGGDTTTWTYAGGIGCQISVGQTCTVMVDFNPHQATDFTQVIDLGDTTSRMRHHVRISAHVVTRPDAPTEVKALSTYSGVDLSWRAPFSGNSKLTGFVVRRSVNGIDTTFQLPPDQYRWTEPHPSGGPNGATYRVSAVNEIGNGPEGAGVSPRSYVPEQLTVFAGRTGEPASLGDLALPVAQQIVPEDKAPAGERTELTGSPNGRDLAYTLAEGETDGLWLRTRDSSGAVADRKLLLAPGIRHPAWSPDGARIAFTASGGGSTTCVDVIGVADGSVVRVGCGIDFPTWNSDSRALIVQDKRLAGAPLARVEAREQGARIATLPGSAGATNPTIAPTGTWLAFLPSGKNNQVGFLPIGGGTPKLTTVPSGTVEAISWDTTGERLGVLLRSGDTDLIERLDARAVMTSDEIVQWDYVYGTGSGERIADFTWQGQRPVIKPTPSISGRSISIPFDISALRVEAVSCLLDEVHYSAGCTSPFTATGLSTGTHKLQVSASFTGYPSTNNYRAYATRTFYVDATGPVTQIVSPTYATTVAPRATVRYAGTDISGVTSYDVRFRRASYGGTFGAYAQPWTGIKTTSVDLGISPGYEYCFSARARDKFGTIGAWSPDRCFSRALDDRSLTASSGWTRQTSSLLYLGTGTSTGTYNASLTRTVQAKRVFVVATRCPTCGTAAVYLGTRYIGVLNLYAATTQRQVIVALPAQSAVFSGTLRIAARSSGKLIQIDGLGVRRT